MTAALLTIDALDVHVPMGTWTSRPRSNPDPDSAVTRHCDCFPSHRRALSRSLTRAIRHECVLPSPDFDSMLIRFRSRYVVTFDW
jgi:hypothetical protein